MFQNIAAGGQWDMSEPKLWGYFFTHRDGEVLREAAIALQARDYEFVDIWLSEKDDPDAADLWWLHMQRVEVHTVDSLHARNEQLTEFAASNGIDSYDGMDVGPVESGGRST